MQTAPTYEKERAKNREELMQLDSWTELPLAQFLVALAGPTVFA